MVIRRLAALVFGLAGLSPAVTLVPIPGGFFTASTTSGAPHPVIGCNGCVLPEDRGDGVTVQAFGTTAWGVTGSDTYAPPGTHPYYYPEAPGFSGNAATWWFQDYFGMFARASANTVGPLSSIVVNQGNAFATGSYFEQVVIPAQGGAQNGDRGIFKPHFQLEGTVNLNWGGPGAGVLLDWSFGGQWLVRETWYADHLSTVVNRDLTPEIPFIYGELFTLSSYVKLTAYVMAATAPAVGYAEGDFSHTGTLAGVTVLDKFGNPISNPLILSATGFDYANPQGVTATPEPARVLLMGGALGALILGRRRIRPN